MFYVLFYLCTMVYVFGCHYSVAPTLDNLQEEEYFGQFEQQDK
jgi:hypothetical protein